MESLSNPFHFSEREFTYETFFCVHSRSPRTSRASRIPSANRSRVRARRACACFWRSISSRCFALSLPDLQSTVSENILRRCKKFRRVEPDPEKLRLRGLRVFWICLDGTVRTHVCAWTAMLRSSGMGLKELAKRSCMYS